MSKKRAIVSYDKLSEDMKDRLEDAFPDGFGGGMTQIKTPTGETLDALLWETDEIIYLIKLNKVNKKPVVIPQEDDEEEEDDIDDIEEEEVKVEEAEDVADDEEDDFDEPADEEEDSDEE
jgi:hypothetical protein